MNKNKRYRSQKIFIMKIQKLFKIHKKYVQDTYKINIKNKHFSKKSKKENVNISNVMNWFTKSIQLNPIEKNYIKETIKYHKLNLKHCIYVLKQIKKHFNEIINDLLEIPLSHQTTFLNEFILSKRPSSTKNTIIVLNDTCMLSNEKLYGKGLNNNVNY